LADVQDKHKITYGTSALTKLVGKVKVANDLAEIRQQDRDQSAFAMAIGYAKYQNKGDEKWVYRSKGGVRNKMRAGFLELGGDILRVVATFLSQKAWTQRHTWIGGENGGHEGAICSFSFSPNGLTVASASEDYTLKLWDVSSGKLKRTIPHENCVECCAFSPDSTCLLSACVNTLLLWDAGTGTFMRAMNGHTNRIYCSCFSPDSGQILSASDDKSIKLWSPFTGQILQSVKVDVPENTANPPICCCCFSNDGRFFLAGCNDSTLKLWKSASCELIRTFKGHSRGVTACQFSPCDKTILSSSHDGTIKLWSAETGKLCSTLVGHSDIVWDACFSPDGKKVLSASSDKTLMLWHVLTGQILQVFNCSEDGEAFSCSFSPDGKTLVGGTDGGNMVMWGLS
jgi:WD40 repeat protein